MSTKLKKMIMLVVTLAFLTATGLMVEPLYEKQVKYDLTNPTIHGVSPGVVLATTALGAMRGVLVDVVWMRMESLKESAKFFEIVQLADLACRLTPNFAKVWDYNAWNLAYNVSVQIPDFEERWLWVKKSLDLLRDEAIPNNPTEPTLYFSLAWTYFHKVGEFLDEAHFFYKEKFGKEMHEVFGGSGTLEVLKQITAAPKTTNELLKSEVLKEYYNKCVAEGFDPLREDSTEKVLNYFKWVRRPDIFPKSVATLMTDERNKDLVDRIAAFARARRLERMRMDPNAMIKLVELYGPLDWRNAYSHAIYWATAGMEEAQAYKMRVAKRNLEFGITEQKNWEFLAGNVQKEYNDIDYDRVIYGSLQYLVTRGRLMFDSRGEMLPMMGPDYRFTDAMIKQFELVSQKYGQTHRWAEGVHNAYEFFLIRVSVEFFYRGDTNKSEKYYAMLRERFPRDAYKVPYDEFINKQMETYVMSLNPDECRNLVTALLTQSFFYLGCGEYDMATGLQDRATGIREKWYIKRDINQPSQRVNFDECKDSALMDIFAGKAGFPDDVVDGLKKELSATDAGIVKRYEEKVAQIKKEQVGIELRKKAGDSFDYRAEDYRNYAMPDQRPGGLK